MDQNKFCKYNDYVITDQSKQPLSCIKETDKCAIANFQKAIDNPSKYADLTEKYMLDKKEIKCDYYDDNGKIKSINDIDENMYMLTSFDSTETESTFYQRYSDVTKGSGIDDKKIEELKTIHNKAKSLFRDSGLSIANEKANERYSIQPVSEVVITKDDAKPKTNSMFFALMVFVIFCVGIILALIFLLATKI